MLGAIRERTLARPRFSFLHKMSTQGEVSLDSLRDSVPEDEIVPEKTLRVGCKVER